jgi:hypothetical protein
MDEWRIVEIIAMEEKKTKKNQNTTELDHYLKKLIDSISVLRFLFHTGIKTVS